MQPSKLTMGTLGGSDGFSNLIPLSDENNDLKNKNKDIK